MACLTSSPDKRSLVVMDDVQKRKKKTIAVLTGKKTKKQATLEISDDEDETWPCLVCGESFLRRKIAEKMGPVSNVQELGSRALHTRLHGIHLSQL